MDSAAFRDKPLGETGVAPSSPLLDTLTRRDKCRPVASESLSLLLLFGVNAQDSQSVQPHQTQWRHNHFVEHEFKTHFETLAT